MKRILLLLLTGIAMTVQSQTSFRDISFREALEAAKSEKKLVFIDMMTTWCGPCKTMAREVFPQKKVGEFMNSRFVCLKIDAEKGEGIDIAKTYDVTAYPTFLILDTEKRLVARSLGMKQAEPFIEEITRLLDTELTPERMKARYEQGERTPKLIKNYTAHLLETTSRSSNNLDKWQQAQQIIQEYFNGLTDKQKMSADNLFIYTNYVRSINEAPARFMTQHIKQFPADCQQEVQAVCKRLYRDEARRMLSGEKTTTPEMIESFKKDLKTLSLNSDGHYDSILRLIEAYPGDDEQYLLLCRELFNQIDPSLTSALMDGMSRKCKTKDETTRLKASRIIRDQLPDMNVRTLYTATMTIMRLEGVGQ